MSKNHCRLHMNAVFAENGECLFCIQRERDQLKVKWGNGCPDCLYPHNDHQVTSLAKMKSASKDPVSYDSTPPDRPA